MPNLPDFIDDDDLWLPDDPWLRKDDHIAGAYYQALLDRELDEAERLDAIWRRWAAEIFMGWWTGQFRGLNE